MARIEEIERRLLNWARWRIGSRSGGLGYATLDLDAQGGRDGYREAVIPTVDCEAEETGRAVMALESHLRATVECVYLAPGPMKRKVARLCVSEATMKARIWDAHRRMSAWFADRQQIARQERERVERLGRQAAPGGR